MATKKQIESMGFSATRVSPAGPDASYVDFVAVEEARGFADAARHIGHEASVYRYLESSTVYTTL